MSLTSRPLPSGLAGGELPPAPGSDSHGDSSSCTTTTKQPRLRVRSLFSCCFGCCPRFASPSARKPQPQSQRRQLQQGPGSAPLPAWRDVPVVDILLSETSPTAAPAPASAAEPAAAAAERKQVELVKLGDDVRPPRSWWSFTSSEGRDSTATAAFSAAAGPAASGGSSPLTAGTAAVTASAEAQEGPRAMGEEAEETDVPTVEDPAAGEAPGRSSLYNGAALSDEEERQLLAQAKRVSAAALDRSQRQAAEAWEEPNRLVARLAEDARDVAALLDRMLSSVPRSCLQALCEPELIRIARDGRQLQQQMGSLLEVVTDEVIYGRAIEQHAALGHELAQFKSLVGVVELWTGVRPPDEAKLSDDEDEGEEEGRKGPRQRRMGPRSTGKGSAVAATAAGDGSMAAARRSAGGNSASTGAAAAGAKRPANAAGTRT